MKRRSRPPAPLGRRLHFAGFLALLVTLVSWSVHGVAQSSASELFDFMPKVGADSERTRDEAQWCTVLHEAPQVEISALENETDGEPVAPELPAILRPVFGCTARPTPSGQVLHVVTETYTARFATSPVLARAPPAGS